MRAATGVILFLVMYGIKILGNSMFERESLGDGDIKLMLVLGIALGIVNSFVCLFFASVIALIIYAQFLSARSQYARGSHRHGAQLPGWRAQGVNDTGIRGRGDR